MSFRAMPFLYVNMGGEMIYILEQRLQAQQVGREKAERVLADVVTTLLSRPCLKLLFETQPLYSRQALRHYFEQIAHSSVMRLNESSMDKLFDLMSMAVKYQVLMCKEPSELVWVTVNHLDGMRQLCEGRKDVVDTIDYANKLLMDGFSGAPQWEMAAIRSELMNYFAGQRIKISLLLRDGRQLEDGRFALYPTGEPIALVKFAVPPGSVRYIGSLGEIARVEKFDVEDLKFSIKDPKDMSRATRLGENMYGAPGGDSGASLADAGGGGLLKMEGGGRRRRPSKEELKPSGNEVKLLEMLLERPPPTQWEEDGPVLAVSLFEDEEEAQRYEKDKDDDTGRAIVSEGEPTTAAAAAGAPRAPQRDSSKSRLSKKLRETMRLQDEERAESEGEEGGEEGNEDDEGAAIAGADKAHEDTEKLIKGKTRGEQMLEMMDKQQ